MSLIRRDTGGRMCLRPRALVDPATARALQEAIAETGIGDVVVAERLLHSLNLALTDALSDVFTVQL